jgi:hypothetical protein
MYARFAREYVQYPKIYKHTVGEDIAASFASLRGLLNRAAKLHKKQTALRDADIELENLKDLFWAALELRCITEGQFGLWVGDVTDLGRMLGGWIRSDRSSP